MQFQEHLQILLNPPKGDAFAPRNEYAMQIDFEEPTYCLKFVIHIMQQLGSSSRCARSGTTC